MEEKKKRKYKRGSVIGDIGKVSDRGGSSQPEDHHLLPNPRFYPTSHCRNIPTDTYKGMWISDLSVGHPNGHLIRSFNEHSELAAELRVQRALFKKYRSKEENGVEPNEVLALKAWTQIYKIEKDLIALSSIHSRQGKHNPEDVVNAYVTFNNQESFRRCYEDYANARRHFCCRMSWWKTTPLPLLFNGDVQLLVDRAPDPSDILWENLEKTDKEIKKKQCITCGKCLSSLIAATALRLTQPADVPFVSPQV